MKLKVEKQWLYLLVGVVLGGIVVGGVLTALDDAAAPDVAVTEGAPRPAAQPGGSETTAQPYADAPTAAVQAPGAAGAQVPGGGSDEAPKAPVPAGSALGTVTAPPPQTLAMLDADVATADSAYDVRFEVYGYGPVDGTIPTLVVQVKLSTPVGTVSKPYQFSGRNVLAKTSPAVRETVQVGGAYAGTITLRASGSTLVPWLSDVRSLQ